MEFARGVTIGVQILRIYSAVMYKWGAHLPAQKENKYLQQMRAHHLWFLDLTKSHFTYLHHHSWVEWPSSMVDACSFNRLCLLICFSYLILLSRQGKVVCSWPFPCFGHLWWPTHLFTHLCWPTSFFQRLAKWFTTLSPKDKAKIIKDVTQLVLSRRTRMCNFLEYKGTSEDEKCAVFNIPYPGFGCVRDSMHWQVDVSCRYQSRLPKICLPFLHCRLFINRQWTHHTGNRSSLCRTNGQILRQCMWAGHHLQFSKSILHLRWTVACWGNAGKQQKECAEMHQSGGQPGRHGGRSINCLCVIAPAQTNHHHGRFRLLSSPLRLARLIASFELSDRQREYSKDHVRTLRWKISASWLAWHIFRS